MDIFFADSYSSHYNLHILKNNFFIYPFALIKYNGFTSMSSVGYQGPLKINDCDDNELDNFLKIVDNFTNEHEVCTEFIRFNPYYMNNAIFNNKLNIEKSAEFFIIDVKDPPDLYLKKLPDRSKNAFKRASGIKLKMNSIVDNSIIFDSLKYKSEFYTNRDELSDICQKDFSILLTAMFEDKEAGASLFFVSGKSAYYIVNSSTDIGKTMSVNLFLIYEFYKYAFLHDIEFIGLGGGLADNDSLSLFKKQFATRVVNTYHSKVIRNRKLYETANENKEGGYFPPYLKNTALLNFIQPPRKQ